MSARDNGLIDETGASSLVRRLRLRHLELLSILNRVRTIHGAAAQMHLTQPAVTRMVKEIEELFGGPLFERSVRGIAPTVPGRLLVDRAMLLMEELRATEEEVAMARRGQSGLLRIGFFSGARSILHAVAVLTRQDPLLKVELREAQINQLLEALLVGHLDCVLGAVPPDELRHERIDQLRIERLDADAVSVVTHPAGAWARRRRVRWPDLSSARWVLPPRESLLRRALVRTYLELGMAPPEPVVETLAPLNIRFLIEFQAAELGLLRAEHAQAEAALGTLRIVPVIPVAPLPPLSVFTRRRASARQALVGKLVAQIRLSGKGGA